MFLLPASPRKFIFLLAVLPLHAQVAPVDLVHPLVGTEREGQTYPAVGVPFAMTQWTPQTRAGEMKCVAPYYYTDPKIQGFRASHFLSGSCVPDYGTVTLMPSVNTLKTNAVKRASAFTRASEQAHPYLYQVTLDDAGIKAEITGRSRAGIMRFTAVRPGEASIVIENNARAGEGYVQIDQQNQRVTGEVPVRREYAESGQPAGFSSYFVIEFSKPFTTFGTFAGPRQTDGSPRQDGDGQPPAVIKVAGTAFIGAGGSTLPTASPRPGFGAYVRFGNANKGDVIQVRIGTSFTSVGEAQKNLQAEIPAWDFDATEADSKADWSHALNAITIKDNIPAATVFYTALYHALLHPRTVSDVSGTYPRFASMGQIENTNNHPYYDDFSMWDIFRAQLPLLTIIDPEREADMVRSLILKGEQGGFLPIFPAWNQYTATMVGDHAAVTIVDAYRKGLRGFDAEEAYKLMRRNALETPQDFAEYKDGKGRRALPSYLKYGYVPLEDHVNEAFHKNEQVSRTLEYAFDDATLGLMAESLGKTDDAALFRARGQNWRKVIDASIGFARGKHEDGSWVTPFDPAGKYTWITEGLPWQYTFFVPQDVPGLVALEGGPDAFARKLDGLFDGKYYDHGNEPSHHIAYLYDASATPWKGQAKLRSLMESEYRDAPGGLAGNDDAGQMSAWYVLTALGFYQVAPGVPDYWLGSPRFDEATLNLPNHRTLRILAPGAGTGKVYVQSVTLNGRVLEGYTLQHNDIMHGGVLHFEMSDRTPAPHSH